MAISDTCAQIWFAILYPHSYSIICASNSNSNAYTKRWRLKSHNICGSNTSPVPACSFCTYANTTFAIQNRVIFILL